MFQPLKTLNQLLSCPTTSQGVPSPTHTSVMGEPPLLCLVADYFVAQYARLTGTLTEYNPQTRDNKKTPQKHSNI